MYSSFQDIKELFGPITINLFTYSNDLKAKKVLKTVDVLPEPGTEKLQEVFNLNWKKAFFNWMKLIFLFISCSIIFLKFINY